MKYSLLFIILFFSGCAGSQNENEIAQEQENVDPILSPYFLIVEALSNDDMQMAKEKAKVIAGVEPKDGVELALKRMGQLMNEANSLYDQRSILEQFGMVIPLYIEKGVINDYPIYKFKCVNEYDGKEVVWFSQSKSSRNPFIGDKSSECVELHKTIEPVIKN